VRQPGQEKAGDTEAAASWVERLEYQVLHCDAVVPMQPKSRARSGRQGFDGQDRAMG
jgi:hypothetical protein